ncbi:MAG: RNA polymerase sigma factor [Candidatus Binatia bacterium]
MIAVHVKPAGPRDPELLSRIARGDEEALGELIRRYRNRFYGVARRMLGDGGDAEDALQITFFRVFRHAAAYREEWGGSAWLYRILTNVCIDQWRKRRTVSAAVESFARLSAPAVSGERVDVDRALAKLPPEARAILILCYVEELSYGEIARARGISVNTVKTQLLRAKRFMRKHLREEEK